MLKTLALVALLLSNVAILAILLPCHAARAESQQAHSQNKERPTQGSALPPPANENTGVHNYITNNPAPQAAPQDDSLARTSVYINAFLVLITISIAIAGLIQARASQKSATAAEMAAKAVINVERPWFLVSIDKVGGADGKWVVRAINKGNTPAEFVEAHCSCMPHPSDFIPPVRISDPILAPKHSFFVKGDGFEIRELDLGKSIIDADGFNRAGFMDDPKFLFVYGWVSYWDTFVDRSDPKIIPHVTSFIFMYNAHANSFGRAAGKTPQTS